MNEYIMTRVQLRKPKVFYFFSHGSQGGTDLIINSYGPVGPSAERKKAQKRGLFRKDEKVQTSRITFHSFTSSVKEY